MTSIVPSSARVKDMLIECISKDVKELQHSHSDVDTANNLVANSDEAAKQLCEHLDHVLLHGLKDLERGYWAFVTYFTRMDAVKTINKLTQVTTELGKGRAWLYLSLNEQATESYLRMFTEYQDQVLQYYNQDAFLSDIERLLLLQTLITGLDFICFDFTIDTPYLDYSASEPSLDSGIQDSLSYTLAVEPQFISKLDKQKSKPPVTSGGIYSRYTIGDKHENYHLKQTTTGTTPLSQSAKLNLTADTLSSNYPLLLGSQNSENKATVTKSTADVSSTTTSTTSTVTTSVATTNGNSISSSNSSKEHKRRFPENISPISVPSRGPDAVYNVSTTLVSQDDGEIEVTSVKKSKGKKKKGKKKKKASTEADIISKQVVDDDQQTQKQDDLLNVTNTDATSLKPNNGSHDTAMTSSALANEYDHNNSTVADDKYNVPMISEDSTDSSHHRQPQSKEVSNHISPHKLSPETLSTTEQCSHTKPSLDATLDNHVNSADVNMPSLKMAAKSDSTQKSIKPETLSNHSSTTNHRPQLGELMVDNHHHKELQVDQFTSKNSEPRKGYEDRMSPQEESWVKQLFVARDKSIAQGEVHQRGLQNNVEFDKKRFTSNAAKFTTMIEEPSSGETGKARQRNHERPKAVLLPVDGPTVGDVKELLRKRDLTDAEIKAIEMNVDQNTRLIFSLEIFLDSNEEMIKLIQVSSPDEQGNRQMAFVLVTNQAVYLLRKDGADHEGLDYSREAGIPLERLVHLVIGLNWQSVVIEHKTSRVVVLTGNEAVTRAVVEAINNAVLNCNQCHVPLNKGDDLRMKALAKEIDKIDQNGYMILQYSLVNWEQLKGDLPAILMPQLEQNGKSGVLYYKAVMLGMTYWKQGYFVIRNGNLSLYNSENDKTAKTQYSLCNKSCGGCKRLPGERLHSFVVVFKDSSDLVLSANSEEEMLNWMQALCEAVVGKKPVPNNRMTSCISCGALITSNKVCIIKEEWIGGLVKETVMTSCNIDDITSVEVDPLLPLYCIICYDPSERSDAESISWLICFESTHELSKFSIRLAEEWKKTFQIDIDFTEVKDDTVKQRAYKAVDLMQASRYRSDSITRGRGVPLMI